MNTVFVLVARKKSSKIYFVKVDRRGRWPPAMADYVGHLALQCTCAQAGCDEVLPHGSG